MPIHIYALTDPDTGEPRYVGKGASLSSRRADHIAMAKRMQRRPLDRWIAGLLAEGKRPGIRDLEVVADGESWSDRECHWTWRFKRQGCSLLNVRNNGEAKRATGPKSATAQLPADLFNRLLDAAEDNGLNVAGMLRRIVEATLGEPMPNQPKTKASTYRLDDETLGLLDALAGKMEDASGLRANRTDVIRFAVRRLAEKEGLARPKRNQKKTG